MFVLRMRRASLSRVMQLECADVNTVSVAAPDDNNDEPESDPENAVIGEVYQPPVPETNDEGKWCTQHQSKILLPPTPHHTILWETEGCTINKQEIQQ